VQARKQRVQPLIIVAVILLSIGLSAAIGFTDEGRIDVAETIEARNQRILNNTTDERDAGTPTDVLIPVQNTQVVPTSALIPIPDDQLLPPPLAASSTASSTATSTQTVTEDAATATSISTGEGESAASSSSEVSEAVAQ
jgi:hypothetical protein